MSNGLSDPRAHWTWHNTHCICTAIPRILFQPQATCHMWAEGRSFRFLSFTLFFTFLCSLSLTLSLTLYRIPKKSSPRNASGGKEQTLEYCSPHEDARDRIKLQLSTFTHAWLYPWWNLGPLLKTGSKTQNPNHPRRQLVNNLNDQL